MQNEIEYIFAVELIAKFSKVQFILSSKFVTKSKYISNIFRFKIRESEDKQTREGKQYPRILLNKSVVYVSIKDHIPMAQTRQIRGFSALTLYYILHERSKGKTTLQDLFEEICQRAWISRSGRMIDALCLWIRLPLGCFFLPCIYLPNTNTKEKYSCKKTFSLITLASMAPRFCQGLRRYKEKKRDSLISG